MEKQQFRLQLANEENETGLLVMDNAAIDERLRAFVHCSVAYIRAMLQKTQPTTDHFFIDIEIERTTSGSPKSIHLAYHIAGRVSKGEAWKSCHHSIQKHCPLAQAMQKMGTKITWELKVASL